MTDGYTKMAKAIPTSKTIAVNVVIVFVDHFIVLDGIPGHLLASNGPPFVKTFMAILCAFLKLKDLTTTASHPQSIDQVKRCNIKIVTRLQYYFTEHQENWDIFVQLPTYANNTWLIDV